MFKSYFIDFVNLIFPRLCVLCHNDLEPNVSTLCLTCLYRISETPLNSNKSSTFFRYDAIQSAFCFLNYEKENVVQRAIYLLKYKDRKELGELLGSLCADAWKESCKMSENTLIVPVPLHKKKLKKRGYNQSEYFAKGLSRNLGIPYDIHSLIRKQNTETQTKKDYAERWTSVKSAFEVVSSDNIKDKHILLVDDVLTTGSTVEACALKLKPFVKSIEVIVIASPPSF